MTCPDLNGLDCQTSGRIMMSSCSSVFGRSSLEMNIFEYLSGIGLLNKHDGWQQRYRALKPLFSRRRINSKSDTIPNELC
jgi:hypothetical protein